MKTATYEWKTLVASVSISRAEATRFWFMHGQRLEDFVEIETERLARRLEDDLINSLWGDPGPTI